MCTCVLPSAELGERWVCKRKMSARYSRLCAVLYTRCTSALILLYVRLSGTPAQRETQLVVGFDFPVASRYVGLASTSRGRINGEILPGLVRVSVTKILVVYVSLAFSLSTFASCGRYKQVSEEEARTRRTSMTSHVCTFNGR